MQLSCAISLNPFGVTFIMFELSEFSAFSGFSQPPKSLFGGLTLGLGSCEPL